MAVKETVEFDLDLIDRLIAEEEATLEPKHRASIEYRDVAARHVAGGVIGAELVVGLALCAVAKPAGAARIC